MKHHGLSQKMQQFIESRTTGVQQPGEVLDRGAAAVAAAPVSEGVEDVRFGHLLTAGGPLSEMEAKTLKDQLASLAGDMLAGAHGATLRDDDCHVDAGMIFFGQFIDHDITLDLMSELGKFTDPESVQSLRTPRLELDSVYGSGMDASPYLYDQERNGYLLVGTDDNPVDLPRNRQGVALIGDFRNDENGLLSQLQSLFLRFHNRVLERIEKEKWEQRRLEEEKLTKIDIINDMRNFEFARRVVRWHYQWLVRNAYLPAIIEPSVLSRAEKIVQNDGKGSVWQQFDKGIPVEFSAAAFRFGHSQVRSRYRLQRNGPERALFRDLTSFEPVPTANNVDWLLFFDNDEGTADGVQKARPIDTELSEELFILPFVSERAPENSLAFRNLVRGSLTFRLISGEDAVQELGVKSIDTPKIMKKLGLSETPLWYYCLAEAEKNNGKLGPVGGQIVAVTLLRMLHNDPQSYVSVDPSWRPFLAGSDDFSPRDLVLFVEQDGDVGSTAA